MFMKTTFLRLRSTALIANSVLLLYKSLHRASGHRRWTRGLISFSSVAIKRCLLVERLESVPFLSYQGLILRKSVQR